MSLQKASADMLYTRSSATT